MRRDRGSGNGCCSYPEIGLGPLISIHHQVASSFSHAYGKNQGFEFLEPIYRENPPQSTLNHARPHGHDHCRSRAHTRAVPAHEAEVARHQTDATPPWHPAKGNNPQKSKSRRQAATPVLRTVLQVTNPPPRNHDSVSTAPLAVRYSRKTTPSHSEQSSLHRVAP